MQGISLGNYFYSFFAAIVLCSGLRKIEALVFVVSWGAFLFPKGSAQSMLWLQ